MLQDSEKFKRLTEELLTVLARLLPFWATEVGDHRFDSELGDFSDEGIRAGLRELAGFARRLRSEIRPEGLTPDENLDWEVLFGKLDSQVPFYEETQPWKRDPTLYVTHTTDAIFALMASQFDSPSTKMEKAAARLGQIPQALREARRNLADVPAEFVDTAIRMAEGSLEYFQPLLKLFPRQKKEVLASWHGYLEFLKKELRPRAGGSPKLGKEKYDYLLKKVHLLDWDHRELLELGDEAFRKTQEEIAVHAATIQKGEAWLQVLNGVREPFPSSKELIPFYRRLTQEAREFVAAKRLMEIPADHNLQIDETPPYERPVIASACYIPVAVLNPTSQGRFFVTPAERSLFFWRTRRTLRKEHTFSEALLTVVHESFPGHHLQFLHAARHPSKLRRLFYDEFYGEGWAFYVEQMMLEQGFHATPETWLFQKRNELWRALRVLIDVKLHTQDDFSGEAAAQLMMRHLGYDALYAHREAHRYLLDPVQATSYYVGKQELLRLREEVARKQGNQFRLDAFHNAFLSTGSLPFKYVRKLLL